MVKFLLSVNIIMKASTVYQSPFRFFFFFFFFLFFCFVLFCFVLFFNKEMGLKRKSGRKNSVLVKKWKELLILNTYHINSNLNFINSALFAIKRQKLRGIYIFIFHSLEEFLQVVVMAYADFFFFFFFFVISRYF